MTFPPMAADFVLYLLAVWLLVAAAAEAAGAMVNAPAGPGDARGGTNMREPSHTGLADGRQRTNRRRMRL
jgi:hypothetical protein